MKRILAAYLCLVLLFTSLAVCSSCSSPKREAVWLPTKVISYSSSDGSVESTVERTYDDRGNVMTFKSDATGKTNTTTLDSSCYDSNGFQTKSRTQDGTEVKYENVVTNGQLVKTSASGYVKEYKYHSNGVLKTATFTQEKSDEVTTQEWNENGLQLSSTTRGGKYPTESIYTWKLADDGTPESCVIKHTTTYSSPYVWTYTFKLDSNGNITEIYLDGKLREAIEYVKIENPNEWAWVQGNKGPSF